MGRRRKRSEYSLKIDLGRKSLHIKSVNVRNGKVRSRLKKFDPVSLPWGRGNVREAVDETYCHLTTRVEEGMAAREETVPRQ